MQARIHNNQIEMFTDVKDEARDIMDAFSAFAPDYLHDTRFRMGRWDGKEKFYEIQVLKEGWMFTIPIGFKERINRDFVEIENTKTNKPSPELLSFLKSEIPKLPFKPYKHQLKMILAMADEKSKLGIAATGSGKSLVIYLLLKYYRSQNKKVLVVVPTIDLTIQLRGDFVDYNATEEFQSEVQLMGGEFNSKEVVCPILVSTYQSCVKANLKGFDVVINDETHLAKAETL